VEVRSHGEEAARTTASRAKRHQARKRGCTTYLELARCVLVAVRAAWLPRFCSDNESTSNRQWQGDPRTRWRFAASRGQTLVPLQSVRVRISFGRVRLGYGIGRPLLPNTQPQQPCPLQAQHETKVKNESEKRSKYLKPSCIQRNKSPPQVACTIGPHKKIISCVANLVHLRRSRRQQRCGC
jgi:hypothetical protein